MKASFVAVVLALTALSVSAFFLEAIPRPGEGKLRSEGAEFIPAPLPCSYSILAYCEMYQQGTLSSIYNESFHRDGLLAAEGIYQEDYANYGIFRYDLAYNLSDVTYIPVFGGEKSYNTTCKQVDGQKEYVDESIEKAISLFTENSTYDSVDRTSFKGRKCWRYYKKERDYDLQLFVSDTDYIIGAVWRDEEMNTLIAEVDYAFNISTSLFALDPYSFPGCDQRAYIPPMEQC